MDPEEILDGVKKEQPLSAKSHNSQNGNMSIEVIMSDKEYQ